MFTIDHTSDVIDATFVGNGARFANHSCEPNAVSKAVGAKVYLFAIRDINVGEEIVYDYRIRKVEGRRLKCDCGSKNCKGYIDHIIQ